jgi:hypothetical protein
MIKKHGGFGLACLVAAGLLAACGGGGGGSSVVPSTGITVTPTPAGGTGGSATSAPLQTLSMTVTIPKSTTKTSTNKRSAEYIAANTASMTMTLLSVNSSAVTAATPQGPFNLTTASNPNCVTGANGTTCTFSFSAPVGTDIFVANTYSGANATGSSLGSGAVMFSVRQNASNVASLSLTGPVASVQLLTGTATLNNGNPMSDSGSSGASVARTPGSRAAAAKTRLANHRASRSVKASSSKRSALTSSSTGLPPATLSSRLFVIALDAAGNQIINPTTLDAPITLKLNYNGAPAGSLSLNTTYAGLTTADTGTATTTADGGTIVIYAPTDIVTLTLAQSVTGSSTDTYAPNVSAVFTPTGSATPVNVPAVTYTVSAPPPAAYLIANASHVDPFTVGSVSTETMSITNGGTAPTSGVTEAYVYSEYAWTYDDNVGSDPSWSCTPEGYYVYCSTSAVISVGGSLPLVFHITPSTSGAVDLYADGGNSANNYNGAEVYDDYTVLGGPTPTPAPSSSPVLAITFTPPPTFYATVPGAFIVNVQNNGGSAFSGTATLTNTVPSDYTLDSAIGTTWTCTGAAPTITCTTSASPAPNATFPPVTLTLTAPVAETNVQSTISSTISGGNAASPAPSGSTSVTPISPISFSGTSFAIGTATGNAFAAGPAAQLTLGAPPINGAPGTVSIMTQSASSGTYSLNPDNCSGSIIDSAFSLSFPLTAAGVATPQPVSLNYTPSPTAESCSVTISDSLGNQATLGVAANSANITVQGTRRLTGVHH